MRRLVVLNLLAATLVTASAIPATAQPNRSPVTIISTTRVDDQTSAFLSEVCGTDLFAEGFFRLIIKTFDEGSDVVEINVWHIGYTITNSKGETYDLLDVGPDVYYIEDGQLHVAISGRSITGSGWIGQVVIDLETGEVVSETGLFQGDANHHFAGRRLCMTGGELGAGAAVVDGEVVIVVHKWSWAQGR